LNGIEIAASLDLAIENADAIILLVRHTEFCKLDPRDVASKTNARILIDCVNGWDDNPWETAGFHVFRLGVRY
jgi:hypothetical protein